VGASTPLHAAQMDTSRRRMPRRALFGAAAGATALLVGSMVTGLLPLPLATRAPRRTATGRGLPFVGPLTYAAIGASDAVGMGVGNPARDGWVPVFARRLPAGTRLVNLGVPGITLGQAVEGVLPRAVAAQPDLVTVWLVINDVLEQVPIERYRTDLDRLIGGLTERTTAQIAVGNVPNPPAALAGIQLPALLRGALVARWNGAIAEACRRHGATLVDLYSRWQVSQHPEYIGPDGLHPTVAGYAALAESFFGELRDDGIV
jgi:lysophospholipase L1-like esterase